ncbi:hypothetical protein [Candidatus Poriferisocius sp.]|uniref:hypothetical protein n=1 Tax=Candidatus Poriferisocius sp. TaxID=3101276 RepID=UPI003B02AA66
MSKQAGGSIRPERRLGGAPRWPGWSRHPITEAARARNTAGSFPYPGGEPATIGAVVAWLATSPDADDHLGAIVYAQSEFKKRDLQA